MSEYNWVDYEYQHRFDLVSKEELINEGFKITETPAFINENNEPKLIKTYLLFRVPNSYEYVTGRPETFKKDVIKSLKQRELKYLLTVYLSEPYVDYEDNVFRYVYAQGIKDLKLF